MNRARILLVATRNQGKLRELGQLLHALPFDLRALDHFPSIKSVAETGKTFLDNASLKASGYARQTRLLTLADDSGLQVYALGGAPGILSARYAGEEASDAERTKRLLSQLSPVPDAERTGRFVSAIAIANEHGEIIHLARGVCEGRIATAPCGSAGFGYDPVFIPRGFDETFGELPPEIKNQISHRARALAETHDFLRSLTVDSSAG